MLTRLGETLFSVGGVMMVAGLLMARFPKAVGWFGKLPGDFMTANVFAPITSMLVVSLSLSLVSSILAFILKALK